MDSITDPTIAEILNALDEDGVWIDPAFARSHDISNADEAAIEKAVASSEQAHVKVVLVDIDYDDARFQGNFSNLSAWLQDEAGGDATYVGFDKIGDPDLSVQAYGTQPETMHVANVAAHEHPGDLAEQVIRVSELLDDGNAEALWREVPVDEKYSWTEDDGLQTSEVAAAVAVAVAVAAVLAWWRRRRRSRPKTRGFALPESVLHTVREAEDRRLRADADAKVLALGEALGAGEPSGSANSLAAWQAALDHYEVASAILTRDPAPADVVGALVLARLGESARAAAQSKKPAMWKPPRPCWFNPLHDGLTSLVAWREDQREVDVPACAACARKVRDGEEPDDVLDFIEGDRTVHYFRLDLGTWTTTGYGALERDLLGALRSRR